MADSRSRLICQNFKISRTSTVSRARIMASLPMAAHEDPDKIWNTEAVPKPANIKIWLLKLGL